MESSPLIKAHDHARAAATATRTSDTTVAVTEHTLAAGEFSIAAKSTSSIEALRTLALLEQHHRKLSELLQAPLEQASENSNPDSDAIEVEEKQGPGGGVADPAVGRSKAASSATLSTTPGSLKPIPGLTQHRHPARDLSSSIASKLASARGIKSRYRRQPLIPSISSDQAPGEVHSGHDGSSRAKVSESMDQSRKPSWIPPAQAPRKEERSDTESPRVEEKPSTPNDEGFSRFYSTFGSIINRLSAPLAFAGLPLASEDASPVQSPVSAAGSTTPKRGRQKSTSVSADPDLSRIYSKATLRALGREGHVPSDSFYVVPTSGHTVSYANILSFDQKERRRLAASIHSMEEPDEDDFVDARESQLPALSPAVRRRIGKAQTERDLQNAIEELYLENSSLKEMLDKQSKRLHAFELNSQSSHLALAQSLRLQRPGSPLSLSGAGGFGAGTVLGPTDDELKKRNQELEELVLLKTKRLEVLEKEYGRLQLTLDKYRERWEKLKAGAKARREAQGSTPDP